METLKRRHLIVLDEQSDLSVALVMFGGRTADVYCYLCMAIRIHTLAVLGAWCKAWEHGTVPRLQKHLVYQTSILI